jgi:DNA invertase Pin-like site-specific DNA recombinase
MKIGYARLSAKVQSFQSQSEELAEYGCEQIISENAGCGSEKPELSKIIAQLGTGDHLVVQRLDRLGTPEDICKAFAEIQKKEAKLISLSGEHFIHPSVIEDLA